MFLKNRNISSQIKRSKVTDYAALSEHCKNKCKFTQNSIVAELPLTSTAFKAMFSFILMLRVTTATIIGRNVKHLSLDKRWLQAILVGK